MKTRVYRREVHSPEFDAMRTAYTRRSMGVAALFWIPLLCVFVPLLFLLALASWGLQ